MATLASPANAGVAHEDDAAQNRTAGTLVKRPWTQEEDVALTAAVQKYGAARWSMIAAQLSTGRVGKQCRERWSNHLCPEVKKCGWSEEEDAAIMHGVAVKGTRWCEIIKVPELSGRTDNSIKNRFYTLQRKMKAKQAGVEKATDVSASAPAAEPSDHEELSAAPTRELSKKDHIVAVSRELVFSTDETERDRLIEKLGALCKSYTKPAPLSPDFDLGENMQSLSDHELLQLLSPTSPMRRPSSESHQSSLSVDGDSARSSDTESNADLADDSSTASTVSPATIDGAAVVHKRAPWALPGLCEVDELYEVLELCKGQQGCENQAGCAARELDAVDGRFGATTPSALDEKSKDDEAMDTTAGCLGGKLAYKAFLSPLCLPLDEGSDVESPKRMRTTVDGGSAVPWHSRRPASLSPSGLGPAGGSPLARSPSASSAVSDASSAIEIARELTPPRGVTGTEEPGATREVMPSFAMTGTKEPGTADDAASPRNATASPSSTMTAALISSEVDFISLSTFSNLFGNEIDLADLSSPVISCGKRKDRAGGWRAEP